MKLLIRAAALAVAGGLGYAGAVAWNSPALDLKEVELLDLSGDKVTPAEIRSVSGLEIGDHLLKISTSEVQRNLTAIPWLEKAEVERILPSKIRVTVTERKADFVVMSTGAPFLVDRDGVVLEQGEAPLLHIYDLGSAIPPAGKKIKDRAFSHVSRILPSLSNSLRKQLVAVRAPTVDRITLELVDGTVVVYGAAENVADKDFAVEALMDKYKSENKKLASIDVRVPHRPAVRVR